MPALRRKHTPLKPNTELHMSFCHWNAETRMRAIGSCLSLEHRISGQRARHFVAKDSEIPRHRLRAKHDLALSLRPAEFRAACVCIFEHERHYATHIKPKQTMEQRTKWVCLFWGAEPPFGLVKKGRPLKRHTQIGLIKRSFTWDDPGRKHEGSHTKHPTSHYPPTS